MLLGDLAWGYFSVRRLPRKWMRITAAVFAAAQLLSLLVIIFSRRAPMPLEDEFPRWWESAVFIWHLLVLVPWIVWQLARGSAALVKRFLVQRPSAEPVAEPFRAETTDLKPSKAETAARLPVAQPPAESTGLTRRQFLGAAAVFTPPLISLGAAAYGESQLDSFRIRRIDLAIPNLPPALDGFTIAHVTDVHVGRFTNGRVLEQITEETNKLNADLVALTGDLINDSLRAMPPALEMVRGMRARRMVVTCEGNHDLIDNPREFYRQGEQGGLPLLRGDTASLEVNGQKVQILGLPWSRNPESTANSARGLLAKRDPNAWHLMLAHHPHAWDDLVGVPLTLAGHTHGGQLMLNETVGFGPLFYRYWSGKYQRKDDTLIVSNGTGNWFPTRIHAPAEILHITLRRGTTAA